MILQSDPTSKLVYKLKNFSDLTVDQLYEILYLREIVFTIEQNCPYNDLDYKDQFAQHLMGYSEENKLVSYTRLFDLDIVYPGFLSIGRVVCHPGIRGTGVGKLHFQMSIDYCLKLYGNHSIKIGAQSYLRQFYNTFGFVPNEEHYLEDGIAHEIMIFTP